MSLSRTARVRSVLVVLALLCSTPTEAYRYTFVDLGTLGGTSSAAVAINNSGQIVGESQIQNDAARHAAFWNNGAVIDLGTGGTPFSESRAVGINASGTIAFNAFTPIFPPSPQHGSVALRWEGNQTTPLQSLSGPGVDTAWGINDAGQVVGVSAGDLGSRAVVWNGTVPTDLGTLGGQNATAYAINNAGAIVGYSDSGPSGSFGTRAALWSNGSITDLGSLGAFDFTNASDINEAGQIVGFEHTLPLRAHAVLWDQGQIIDLGDGLGLNSSAIAINNAGQIIGSFFDPFAGPRPVLWQDNQAMLLESLVDPASLPAGWSLDGAADINDAGWIVGAASNAETHEQHAYLLKVIPEPGTVALLALAFGALGASTARRRSPKEPMNRLTVRVCPARAGSRCFPATAGSAQSPRSRALPPESRRGSCD